MPPSPVPKRETFKVPQAFAQALAVHTQGHRIEAEHIYSEVLAHRHDPETIATMMKDSVAIATRLGQDWQFPRTISARMAANRDKVYRDRTPVTALEDFIERSVHG